MDGAGVPATVDIPASDGAGFHDWEDPPRRPREANAAPVLAVDGFAGPLDWLLEQVRGKKIDLARLSIAALVDEFVRALEAALPSRPSGEGQGGSPLASPGPHDGLVLGRWGDFLVMAADLTLLRSRLLLPADAAEARDARAAAEALRRRMVSRAEIGVAVDWLERRPQLGRDVFGFGATAQGRAGAARSSDITSLLRACLAALVLPADATSITIPAVPFWTVADALARVRRLLPEVGEVAMAALLPEMPTGVSQRDLRCRAAVASTFVAALELTRDGAIGMRQGQDGNLVIARAAAPA